MKELVYKDYLHESCDNTSLGLMAIVKPNNIKSYQSYTLEYQLDYNISSVTEQANLFASEVCQKSFLAEIIRRCTPNGTSYKDVISKTYIYSYNKAFNLCVTLHEGKDTYTGNPLSESLGFCGHVEMFKAIYDTYQITSSQSRIGTSSLFKNITLSEKSIEAFKNTAFYKSSSSSRLGCVNGYEQYEVILDILFHKAFDFVSVKCFENQKTLPSNNPVGNFCYYMEDAKDSPKELMYANNPNMLFDTASTFWNTAIGVKISNLPERFVRCNSTPYNYVLVNEIDPASKFAEVYAITGLDINSKFSTFGVDSFSSGDGEDPWPSFGGPRNSNNSTKPENASKKDGSSNDYKPPKNKNIPKKPSGGGNNKVQIIRIRDDNHKTNLANQMREVAASIINAASRTMKNSEVQDLMVKFAVKKLSDGSHEIVDVSRVKKITQKSQRWGGHPLPYERSSLVTTYEDDVD